MADQEEHFGSSDAQASFDQQDNFQAQSSDSAYEQNFNGVDDDRGLKNPRDSDQPSEQEPSSKRARGEDGANLPGHLATYAATMASMTPDQYAAYQSASNLFVNGIPSDYSEDKLRGLFTPYGDIENVKVMWDHLTNRTKGYGFVKFRDPEAANRAIDALNGTKLADRDLLVKVADSGRTQPRPNPNGTPSPNVYINGLPESVDDSQLRSLFGPFGTIIDTKILVDLQSGLSRGQAFVRYEQQASAEHAISALNNYMFPGTARGIMVRFADTAEEKQQRKTKLQQRAAPGGGQAAGRYPPGYEQYYQAYGANYAAYAAQYANYPGYAAAYGQYAAAYPGYAAYAASYPGYGADPNAAAAAYGQGQGAADWSAAYAQQAAAAANPDWSAAYAQQAAASQGGGGGGGGGSSTPQPGSEGHLFIYHLPPDADDALLFRLFGQYGSISSVKVMRDAVTNNCKGFGFVKFGDPSAASAAVAGMNGYQLGNKRLQVSYKK